MIDKIYLIQMDSLWYGGRAGEGADVFISRLIENDLPFLILSEHTGRTRETMIDNMRKGGLKGLTTGDIYTSAMAAVDWVVSRKPEKIRVAGIGGKGLKAAIEKGGFLTDRKNPDLLFIGMDRNMTYMDYSYALQYLLSGADLISTDSRRTQDIDGMKEVGNGAVVKMLEYAANIKAYRFGRGTKGYLQQAMRYLKAKASDIVFVGDDFGKDIRPAIEMGMDTALITHGESIMGLGITEEIHPTWIVEDLYGLAK